MRRNSSANLRASIWSLLLPCFIEAFFRGSHTTNFVTCGFSKSYNQAAQVPSSKVTCNSPRSPSINCRMMLAFVSTTLSSTILPAEFMTAMEMLSLWTSMPIYFVSFIGDAPFGRRSGQHSTTYSRSVPLYCVPLSECGFLPLLRGGQLPISGKMNSALIEFEDGLRVVVSRNALRRVI